MASIRTQSPPTVTIKGDEWPEGTRPQLGEEGLGKTLEEWVSEHHWLFLKDPPAHSLDSGWEELFVATRILSARSTFTCRNGPSVSQRTCLNS